MAKPRRNANPQCVTSSCRTFFLTAKTHGGQALLQSEANAMLLIDVLHTCVARQEFKVHDFVVMPNHVHVLLTVDERSTVERAAQMLKGGFSYRLRKELGYPGEVWQRGFSEVRVFDEESFREHRAYIARNPVKAGLVTLPEQFPFCLASLTRKNRG